MKMKNTRIPLLLYNDPDDGRQRFLLELEFVQCLANPTYIHCLAPNRYFEDEAFIGYLKYLQYWQRPEQISTDIDAKRSNNIDKFYQCALVIWFATFLYIMHEDDELRMWCSMGNHFRNRWRRCCMFAQCVVHKRKRGTFGIVYLRSGAVTRLHRRTIFFSQIYHCVLKNN